MNDARVTATVRYRSGDVWAECSECGAECRAEWEIETDLVYVGDIGQEAETVNALWTVPGCAHIDLPDLVALVEDYLDANNPRPTGPDPDRFRDDNEGRYGR